MLSANQALTVGAALAATACMAAVTFLCRSAPLLFFSKGRDTKARKTFIAFVERAVPPAAMTVLAVTSVAGEVTAASPWGLPALAASLVTALLHIWKRNALLSIAGGTALYMVLSRL